MKSYKKHLTVSRLARRVDRERCSSRQNNRNSEFNCPATACLDSVDDAGGPMHTKFEHANRDTGNGKCDNHVKHHIGEQNYDKNDDDDDDDDDDELDEATCCDVEPLHRFHDLWPTGLSLDHRQHLLLRFHSNERFRDQLTRAPAWLTDDMPPSMLREHLDYERDGISSVLANLLQHAQRSFVLRHVYVFGHIAPKAIRTLLDEPSRFYVFPATCLCSVSSSRSPQLQQDRGRATLIGTREHLLRRCDRARSSKARCLSAVLDRLPWLSESDANVPVASTTVPTAASDPVTTSKSTPPASTKTRLSHHSYEYLRKRKRSVETVLEYVEAEFAAGREALLTHHRHMIVCSRTAVDWLDFVANHDKRLTSMKPLLLADPSLVTRYPKATVYLQTRAIFGIQTSSFRNVAQAVNTLVTLSRPGSIESPVMVAPLLAVARVLLSEWTAKEKKDRSRCRSIEEQLIRSIRNATTRSPYSTKTSALHRPWLAANLLGRFLFFDEELDDEDVDRQTWVVDTSGPRGNDVERLCRRVWVPAAWERDHYYVARPMRRHAVLLYSSLIDQCLSEQIDMYLSVSTLRQPMRRISRAIVRVYNNNNNNNHNDSDNDNCNNVRLYTRIGYVLHLLPSHLYPLRHAHRLSTSNHGMIVVRTGDTSVALKFIDQSTTTTSSSFTSSSTTPTNIASFFDTSLATTTCHVNDNKVNAKILMNLMDTIICFRDPIFVKKLDGSSE